MAAGVCDHLGVRVMIVIPDESESATNQPQETAAKLVEEKAKSIKHIDLIFIMVQFIPLTH